MRPRKRDRDRSQEELLTLKRDDVINSNRMGLPGKAEKHASSRGLAPDTDANEARMRSICFAIGPPEKESARSSSTGKRSLRGGGRRDDQVLSRRCSCGPSGQRRDFYKQLIGETSYQPAVALFSGLSNLLASGQAKGTASHKTATDSSGDARPAYSHEIICRIVGKALLASEMDTLQAHLLPHQLAIGVKAGVGAMPHLARQ